MLTEDSFVIDTVVTISTYGLVGGKSSFEGTVLGVTSHKAVPPTVNAGTTHINLWSTLPTEIKEKIEDDYRSYKYLVLETDEDVIVYLGLAWINPSSLAIVSSRTVTVPLLGFTEPDYTRLKELLRFNGYTVGEITG